MAYCKECRLFLSLEAREKPRVESGLTLIGVGGQEPWLRKASSMVVSDAQTTCDHCSRNLCVERRELRVERRKLGSQGHQLELMRWPWRMRSRMHARLVKK